MTAPVCGPYVCVFPRSARAVPGDVWRCPRCGTVYTLSRPFRARWWRSWSAPYGMWRVQRAWRPAWWLVAWAWLRWALGRVGYWVRPFDSVADARRWRWQERARCGAPAGLLEVIGGVPPPRVAPRSPFPPPDFED